MSVELYSVQVRLRMANNIPEDAVTNTWHCLIDHSEPSLPTERDIANDFVDKLWDFYEAALGEYRSPVMAAGPHEIKFYKVSDPEPRAPTFNFTRTFVTAPAGAQACPSEVAMVFSFQAAALSGAPQNRRRNRVFLGPLNTTALGSATGNGFIKAAAYEGAAQAGLNFSLASESNNNDAQTWRWRVYSPTDQNVMRPENGWMDNAPDIQRRRGVKSTQRAVWIDP